MSALRRRRVMRRKDTRELIEMSGILLEGAKNKVVEQAELDGIFVFLIEGIPVLARDGNILYPTLYNPHLNKLSSVVVDMGAIPYVCNGADVMVPGIVEVLGEFKEGDLIVVRDVRHMKALAVGRALTSSDGIGEMKKGKGIENLHYVGDRLWHAMAE